MLCGAFRVQWLVTQVIRRRTAVPVYKPIRYPIHGILLERLLRPFAVRGDAVDWLRNYLSDRRHTVRFGSADC